MKGSAQDAPVGLVRIQDIRCILTSITSRVTWQSR
jgi:hypothetical protein